MTIQKYNQRLNSVGVENLLASKCPQNIFEQILEKLKNMSSDEKDSIKTNLDFLIGFSCFKTDFVQVFKTISYLKEQLLDLHSKILSCSQNILEKIIQEEVLNYIRLELRTLADSQQRQWSGSLLESVPSKLDYRTTLKTPNKLLLQMQGIGMSKTFTPKVEKSFEVPLKQGTYIKQNTV